MALNDIPTTIKYLLSIPLAFLIVSLAWLVFVYSCMLTKASEATLSTPYCSIAIKIDQMQNEVENMLAKTDLFLNDSNKIIENRHSYNNQNTSLTNQAPEILNQLKLQSDFLNEQKQKLNGMRQNLQDFKKQLHSPCEKQSSTHQIQY